jgi:PAS domain S-box-containing protein
MHDGHGEAWTMHRHRLESCRPRARKGWHEGRWHRDPVAGRRERAGVGGVPDRAAPLPEGCVNPTRERDQTGPEGSGWQAGRGSARARRLPHHDLPIRALAEANVLGLFSGFGNDILEANDRFLEMLGYTREEFDRNGLTWDRITPPEHVPRDREAWAEVSQTQIAHPYERDYYRKDGSRVAAIVGGAMVGPDGQAWSAFAHDIIDRDQLERERAQLLEQERAARVRAERAERRLAFLGAIARSITSSLDLDVVLPRIAEGARDLCRSETAAIFLRDDTQAMRPRYLAGTGLPAGEEFQVDPGRGIGGRAMATGLPVRAEGPLEPSVGTTSAAAPAAAIAVMVVPIAIGGRVEGLLYVGNRAGRPLTDEDETVCVRLADQAAVAIQNARLFTWEQDARALAQAARAQAEDASRAKDEFLAMLGHELRNPLSAITTAVDILARAPSTGERTDRAREVIRRQVAQLTAIVDDLLDVARVTMGKIALSRRPLDLQDAVARCLTSLANSGRTSAHDVELVTEPAWVDADETRIEQIVTNLVENAARYTEAGGRIRVRVAADGPDALIEVSDTGVGISPELLPHVFELFVQGQRPLDRTGGGLGLGLPLVRRLTELHGGTVHAESSGPGQGAAFRVRMPRREPPAGQELEPAAAPATPRRLRIVLVEDNPDGREMLRAFLELDGHEVHEAADGPSGLERAFSLRPDAVIIDIGLPGLDGYELARRLRATEAGRASWLVALTGYGQPQDRRQAEAAGFDVHLVKPISPERVRSALESARGARPR